MTQPDETQQEKLLDAALMHVPFDGWSETALAAAAEDIGIDATTARAIFARGPVDLALAYHARGDQAMVDRLKTEDLSRLKFREKIAAAIRFRLEAIEDRELVRRATTFFALPHHAPDGARAVWQTCDLIWNELGDTSDDVNWYTKRATLAGVYSSTLLYWLGDSSPNCSATWAFLDRRIEDVMQIETLKTKMRESAFLKPFLAGPNWLASQIKPPSKTADIDLPGMIKRP